MRQTKGVPFYETSCGIAPTAVTAK